MKMKLNEPCTRSAHTWCGFTKRINTLYQTFLHAWPTKYL